MPFDSTGLTGKSSDQILDELNKEMLTNLQTTTGDPSVTVDTSETSPMGKFNQAIADRLSDLWDEALLIQAAMRVIDEDEDSQAYGSQLEKLALLVGFLREEDTYSRGDLRFIGDDNTVVPEDSLFANVQGEQFTNKESFTISLDECYSFAVQASVIKDNRDYFVTIDSIETRITSTVSATNQSILTQLETAINADIYVVATAELKQEDGSTEDSGYYLEIVKDSQTTDMSASASQLLITGSVEVEYLVVAVDRGEIFGSADSVNTIITSQTGLDSVYNTDDFIIGETRESDTDLRERIYTDYNVTGSGTQNTIEAVLAKEDNIRSALVEENRTYTTNADGITGKSYECIVSYEGNSQEVADLIWKVKPTGMETFGDISEQVDDASGEPQTVYLSEAVDLFVYFKIDGTTLPASEGEDLPADYVAVIEDSCVELGDEYQVDQDVIGKRFYGVIYGNVSGLDDLNVLVHLTPTLTDINTIVDWREIWEVERKEISTYGTDGRFLINIV